MVSEIYHGTKGTKGKSINSARKYQKGCIESETL